MIEVKKEGIIVKKTQLGFESQEVLNPAVIHNGGVNNGIFPAGSALFDDTLYIYYGVADEQTASASLSLSALIEELLTNAKHNEK